MLGLLVYINATTKILFVIIVGNGLMLCRFIGGHGAMVKAWRSADVAACRAVSKSRLVQDFQRNIMFLPSQS